MPSADQHPYTVGDILISRWGSEMAYIDFYQVIRATSKSFVVRRIEARVMEIVSPGQVVVTAGAYEFRGDRQRRRVRCDADGWHTNVSSWVRAGLWDGAPREIGQARLIPWSQLPQGVR